jgi:PhnB protein
LTPKPPNQETTNIKGHLMKSTTTYLHFNGNCRTAMAFYRECFGGEPELELELMTFPDASGNPNNHPNAPVMHSKLAQRGQSLLMASDYPPGTDTSGLANNFSVFIDCTSAGELEKLFTALSQNGKLTVPPSDTPFGRFAMCDDSFGVSWILNSANPG